MHTLTLLNLETARETEVLNSSGFFCAKVVMRLVAAVTTPWKENARTLCISIPFKIPEAVKPLVLKPSFRYNFK